jgi:cell wall-associated NlpC family hydrolase
MIPHWVNDYIGLPFEEFNCWDLFRKVYREQFNIHLPDFKNEYNSHMDGRRIKKIMRRELYLNWSKKEIPKIGDGIALNIRDEPWHVGIVVSDESMLHTYNKISSCIESFKGPMWQNNIVGFYRYDPRQTA